MIKIDGSKGEGGGQILRTSVALSMVTGKSIHISKIRANRPEPGLSHQHMKSIEMATKICNAKVDGLKIGSEKVKFYPGKIQSGKYEINIETAGSIPLLLQTILPAALYADKKTELVIIGGTDVRWSMDKNYLQHIFLYYLNKKMNLDIWMDTIKRGFYPKGGGKIKITIKPKKPSIIKITERGKSKTIDVHSIASNDLKKRNVAERQLKGFENIIKPTRKFVEYVDTLSPGTSIHAHQSFDNCKLGSTIIGERNKKAEDVGKKCALLLKRQIDSGACLDEWMGDQILPFMALAGGGKVSVAKITNHLKTNILVIEKFLPVKFKIEKDDNISTVYVKSQT